MTRGGIAGWNHHALWAESVTPGPSTGTQASGLGGDESWEPRALRLAPRKHIVGRDETRDQRPETSLRPEQVKSWGFSC